MAGSLARLDEGRKPKELKKLGRLLNKGLQETEGLWPAVRAGFKLVHQVAGALEDKQEEGAALVKRRVRRIVGQMKRKATLEGKKEEGGDKGLAKGLRHFVKVYQSYEPGLFHCYGTPALPRTNNDLEHAFGSHRYHERRATGRKGASPALVLRGSGRLVAGLATRSREVTAADLAGADRAAWEQLRAELETRRERRVERRQFRRDPHGYLMTHEHKLNQSRLPP